MIFRRIQGAALVTFGLVVASMVGCSNGSSADPVSPGTCTSLKKAANDDFCPGTGPTIDCAKVSTTIPTYDGCGVPVQISPANTSTEVQRSSTVKEFGGTGAPDLTCFDKASWPAATTSQAVEITGYVRNFSNGCDVVGTQIEIYTVKRGGADDGALGDRIGTPVVIADGPCSDTTEDCKLVVVDGKCGADSPRHWRKFSYKGVPSETELLIKTGPSASSSGYATLYDYNIYVKNSEVVAGQWNHDIRAIIQSDYSLIPTVAFGGNITAGNGAIAGEVHDCGDIRVSGAIVNVSAKHSIPVGYFTEIEDAPLPDANKSSTSTLGLYAAYDLAPGPARISAVGTVGGKVVSLGYYDVQVFPDAITAMTFRGLRPSQATSAAGN
jgi:hypothetical protein